MYINVVVPTVEVAVEVASSFGEAFISSYSSFQGY